MSSLVGFRVVDRAEQIGPYKNQSMVASGFWKGAHHA